MNVATVALCVALVSQAGGGYQPPTPAAPFSIGGPGASNAPLAPPTVFRDAPVASGVAPAANVQPVAPQTAASPEPAGPPPQAIQYAVALLAAAVENPRDFPLPGRPLPLAEALARTYDRGSQLQVVRKYWDLAAYAAARRWAWEEAAELAELPAERAGDGQALLAAALASADAVASDAEADVRLAQQLLAEATLLPDADTLPLPADAPYVGRYDTKFTTITASTGVVSLTARRLHHTLPLRLEAVAAHGQAVGAAEQAWATAAGSFRQGRGSLAPTLAAHQTRHLARRRFLEAVRRYNQEIAEYALSIVGPDVSREALVSTLIPLPQRGSSPGPAAAQPPSLREVAPTAAFEPALPEREFSPRGQGEFQPPAGQFQPPAGQFQPPSRQSGATLEPAAPGVFPPPSSFDDAPAEEDEPSPPPGGFRLLGEG